jgi:hypothetical protein
MPMLKFTISDREPIWIDPDKVVAIGNGARRGTNMGLGGGGGGGGRSNRRRYSSSVARSSSSVAQFLSQAAAASAMVTLTLWAVWVPSNFDGCLARLGVLLAPVSLDLPFAVLVFVIEHPRLFLLALAGRPFTLAD